MDVWQVEEDDGPMWVHMHDLWHAVNTRDSDSKISRGWGFVSGKPGEKA
jgi:hypothetical protein